MLKWLNWSESFIPLIEFCAGKKKQQNRRFWGKNSKFNTKYIKKSLYSVVGNSITLHSVNNNAVRRGACKINRYVWHCQCKPSFIWSEYTSISEAKKQNVSKPYKKILRYESAKCVFVMSSSRFDRNALVNHTFWHLMWSNVAFRNSQKYTRKWMTSFVCRKKHTHTNKAVKAIRRNK